MDKLKRMETDKFGVFSCDSSSICDDVRRSVCLLVSLSVGLQRVSTIVQKFKIEQNAKKEMHRLKYMGKDAYNEMCTMR